jgi:hypothetical protein
MCPCLLHSSIHVRHKNKIHTASLSVKYCRVHCIQMRSTDPSGRGSNWSKRAHVNVHLDARFRPKYTFVHMYVCMCVCICVCMYVRMYACTYVCKYICMYTHKHCIMFSCIQFVIHEKNILAYTHTRAYIKNMWRNACMHALGNSLDNSRSAVLKYALRISNRPNNNLHMCMYIYTRMLFMCKYLLTASTSRCLPRSRSLIRKLAVEPVSWCDPLPHLRVSDRYVSVSACMYVDNRHVENKRC